MRYLSLIATVFLSALALLFSPGSFAAGPDFSSITAVVDFGTLTTAILAVAAGLGGVYLLLKGAGLIYSAMRGR